MTVTNFITAAILAASLTSQVNAGLFTGNELYNVCVQGANFCNGYIAGAYDSNEYEDDYCPPDGVTLSQMRAIVMKYMDDYPGQRHIPADWIVSHALRGAFPCKGGAK